MGRLGHPHRQTAIALSRALTARCVAAPSSECYAPQASSLRHGRDGWAPDAATTAPASGSATIHLRLPPPQLHLTWLTLSRFARFSPRRSGWWMGGERCGKAVGMTATMTSTWDRLSGGSGYDLPTQHRSCLRCRLGGCGVRTRALVAPRQPHLLPRSPCSLTWNTTRWASVDRCRQTHACHARVPPPQLPTDLRHHPRRKPHGCEPRDLFSVYALLAENDRQYPRIGSHGIEALSCSSGLQDPRLKQVESS